MDHKTSGAIFQEIIVEFSEMNPTTLDQLESKVQEAIRRLSEGLMEWKLNEWNEKLQKRECSACGSKLENRSRSRQIATLVADISYERYRSSCPDCGKVEYPLDEALGLQPEQRLSRMLEELAVLCGASWNYQESEYIMQKLLGRRLSHETIFNKTTEAGKAASSEFEGEQDKGVGIR